LEVSSDTPGYYALERIGRSIAFTVQARAQHDGVSFKRYYPKAESREEARSMMALDRAKPPVAQMMWLPKDNSFVRLAKAWFLRVLLFGDFTTMFCNAVKKFKKGLLNIADIATVLATLGEQGDLMAVASALFAFGLRAICPDIE
jgi:hypothetical protein